MAEPFLASDPLGINLNDVAGLNAMPEQTLLRTGFVDVTAAPFLADPEGKTDSTKAIADAIFFARHHKLAVYFPVGEYRVSDTIPCRAGWSDERTPNHKYLPWEETWPCVLIGDRRGSRRPRMVLAPGSPGFADPGNPKPILDFDARSIKRKNTTDPLPAQEGSTNYQQLLYGIDVEISDGNPGAAVATFNAAEGSTIQDCTFDVRDGYTGILHGPGSGGAIFNLTVNGGAIGMVLYSPRPTCTITGCRFSGQREAGLRYGQRGPLTMVGCEFIMNPGVPVASLSDRSNGSACFVDCRIDYAEPAPDTVAIEAKSSLYVRNTWFRNVGVIVSSSSARVPAQLSTGWSHVVELAVAYDGYTKPMTTPIYIDGKKESGIRNIQDSEAVPEDLRSRHLWDEAVFPYWDRPGCVNVKAAPYNAKGDGCADDTQALQRAIDENKTVFLPKGAYRITKTLQLRKGTELIGISPAYCMLVPAAVPGGDFTSPDNPQPVVQTSDAADADTTLAFFSVFMPREKGKSCYWLDIAGGNTIVRCLCPIIGYTIADIDPLNKEIYPWTNWTWTELDSFSLYLGFLKHFHTSYNWNGVEDEPLGPDSYENGIPNWPMVRVHGNGSGRWYVFVDLDSRLHGLRHRRIVVEDTKGPFALYHAQFQYGHGAAEMEVARSENVAVYGIKNERTSTAILIRDSRNVLLTGVGGPSAISRKRGKVAVENSSNITLACLTPDFHKDRPSMKFPFIHATLKNGVQCETGPWERPVLFKITDRPDSGK